MYATLAKGTSYQMLMFGVVYIIICYLIVGIGKLMDKGDGGFEEGAGQIVETA